MTFPTRLSEPTLPPREMPASAIGYAGSAQQYQRG
jgi:hypothetical protein